MLKSTIQKKEIVAPNVPSIGNVVEFVTALTIIVTFCGYIRVMTLQYYTNINLLYYFSPVDFFYVGLKNGPVVLTALTAFMFYAVSDIAKGEPVLKIKAHKFWGKVTVAFAAFTGTVVIGSKIYLQSDSTFKFFFVVTTHLQFVFCIGFIVFAAVMAATGQKFRFSQFKLIVLTCFTYVAIFLHSILAGHVYFNAFPNAEEAIYGSRKGAWPRQVDVYEFDHRDPISEPRYLLSVITTQFFIFYDAEQKSLLVLPREKLQRAVLVQHD